MTLCLVSTEFYEPIIDRALDIRYFELTPSKIYDYMTNTDDDAVNENDKTDEAK